MLALIRAHRSAAARLASAARHCSSPLACTASHARRARSVCLRSLVFMLMSFCFFFCVQGALQALRSPLSAQIIDVVRICNATLRRRLEEFSDTPSSELTPQVRDDSRAGPLYLAVCAHSYSE
jgi:hypothetical protein